MVAQTYRRKGHRSLGLSLAALALAGGGLWALSHQRAWGDEGRSAASHREVTVGSVEALGRALDRAGNGTVIRLAPGDYPDITISGRNFAGTVTITSAQPDHPARIFAMVVEKSSGLVFRDLDFNPQEGGVRDLRFRFEKSSRLTVDHVLVHGPDDRDNAFLIPGLLFRDSTDVSLTNSHFTRLLHAVQVLNVTGWRVIGNEFWNIRSDGVRGGGVSDALYADNVCTDFHPVVPDHPDCIQLWSTNQPEPGRNIVIRDNLVVRGKGTPTQGIFVRDTFTKMPFENVEISGNLVIGTMYNGISIDGLRGGKVIGNEAIALDGQKTWIRLQRAHHFELRDNIAPKVLFIDSSDIQDHNNHFDEGGHQAYRARLVQWLDAKPERRRKGSVLLQQLVDAAP